MLSTFSTGWLTKLKSLFGKTYTQTKFTTGNHTTNADIAQLQFNNLEIGKWYRISGTVAFSAISGGPDNIDLNFFSGASGTGTRYGILTAGLAANGQVDRKSPNIIFQAVSTNLYCLAASITSGNAILGDSGNVGTKIQLEELPNHEETTKFN